MKTKIQPPLLLVLLLTLLLAACGGAEAEATAVPTIAATATDAPTNTPEPTNTPQPTATATAVPDLTANFVPFSDEFQGITLSHPSDWVATNFFFTILASSQELTEMAMSGETPSEIDGAILLVIGGSTADLGTDDPQAMIEEAIAEFDIAEGELEIISGPTTTSSDGQQTVTVAARGVAEGQAVVALYAVIVNQELGRTAMLIGVTTPAHEAEYIPLMQAVVGTVEIGEANMEAMGDLFGSELETSAPANTLPLFLYETVAGEVAGDGLTIYSFSGAPTVTYDIIVEALDDDLDLVLDLLDENGISLLGGELDETFSGTEAIRGFQPADYGLFTITIRGFAGGTGPFEISLLESSAPQSQLVEPGSELLATTTIEPDGRAVFQLAMEAGRVITAVVTPLNMDVVVAIYGEDDNLILEVDDSWDEETLFFIAPYQGFYELEVRGFAGAGGSFNISLVATPDVILELYAEDVVNGWLDESGQTDYVIELAAGETVIVIAEPEDGFDLVLELLDGDEWRLLDVDDGPRGGSETLTYTATADGLYFIHVRGFAGAANGKFTLTVMVE